MSKPSTIMSIPQTGDRMGDLPPLPTSPPPAYTHRPSRFLDIEHQIEAAVMDGSTQRAFRENGLSYNPAGVRRKAVPISSDETEGGVIVLESPSSIVRIHTPESPKHMEPYTAAIEDPHPHHPRSHSRSPSQLNQEIK